MLRFRLFGIPVLVEPWFWVTSFLLGGGMHIEQREDLRDAVIWMILVFVSILIHELGHALSGRRLAGGHQSIRLWAFGGLATTENGRWTKKGRILTILAGPGAGFLFFLLIVVGILIAFRGTAGLELTRFLAWGGDLPEDLRVRDFYFNEPTTVFILRQLLWINFWWGMVNLLPVHPLDGGQLATELIPSRRKAHLLGAAVGAAVAVVALLATMYYAAIMFGFLAWQNYENVRRLRF